MLAPSQFGVIPELRQPLRGSAGKVAGTVFYRETAPTNEFNGTVDYGLAPDGSPVGQLGRANVSMLHARACRYRNVLRAAVGADTPSRRQ
jgi:hypothetical protein